MIFNFLTGQWPFIGTPREQLVKKINQDALAPSTIRQAVPKDLNDLCVQLLARDPKQRPSGADLREQFGSQRRTISISNKKLLSNASNVFVGREPEVARLQTALNEVIAGQGTSLFIRGQSGYGKSTLARELLDEARQRGAIVLSGRCFERESVPYKAWDDLIDALAQHLSSLTDDEITPILPNNMAALLQVFPCAWSRSMFEKSFGLGAFKPTRTTTPSIRVASENIASNW